MARSRSPGLRQTQRIVEEDEDFDELEEEEEAVEDQLVEGSTPPQPGGLFTSRTGEPLQFFRHPSLDERPPNVMEHLKDLVEKNGGALVESGAEAEIIIADDYVPTFWELQKAVEEQRPESHVEPPEWVDKCVEQGKVVYSRFVKRTLGGRLPGQVVTIFSPSDKEHIVYYLAHRAPMLMGPQKTDFDEDDADKPRRFNKAHRAGNRYWTDLYSSDRPWVKKHPWKAWRNQYVENQEQYDKWIERYVDTNPRLRDEFADRAILDHRDEPGAYEENLSQAKHAHIIAFWPKKEGVIAPLWPPPRASTRVSEVGSGVPVPTDSEGGPSRPLSLVSEWPEDEFEVGEPSLVSKPGSTINGDASAGGASQVTKSSRPSRRSILHAPGTSSRKQTSSSRPSVSFRPTVPEEEEEEEEEEVPRRASGSPAPSKTYQPKPNRNLSVSPQAFARRFMSFQRKSRTALRVSGVSAENGFVPLAESRTKRKRSEEPAADSVVDVVVGVSEAEVPAVAEETLEVGVNAPREDDNAEAGPVPRNDPLDFFVPSTPDPQEQDHRQDEPPAPTQVEPLPLATSTEAGDEVSASRELSDDDAEAERMLKVAPKSAKSRGKQREPTRTSTNKKPVSSSGALPPWAKPVPPPSRHTIDVPASRTQDASSQRTPSRPSLASRPVGAEKGELIPHIDFTQQVVSEVRRDSTGTPIRGAGTPRTSMGSGTPVKRVRSTKGGRTPGSSLRPQETEHTEQPRKRRKVVESEDSASSPLKATVSRRTLRSRTPLGEVSAGNEEVSNPRRTRLRSQTPLEVALTAVPKPFVKPASRRKVKEEPVEDDVPPTRPRRAASRQPVVPRTATVSRRRQRT